jgi:hypothetical protein
MDDKGTFLPHRQDSFEQPTSHERVAVFLVDEDGEIIGASEANRQVTTYPGKLESYGERVKILDPQGQVICDELLKGVTSSINPAKNSAKVLTTINATHFDDPKAGSNPMAFVDVNATKSNPVQFAIWDPTIESYTFSMQGTACGRAYGPLKTQIKVQLPQITFKPELSKCPAANYSLVDNLVDITDPNPVYPSRNGCSNVYEINSTYPFQYQFLQIYKNTTGFVASPGGSTLVTLSMKDPTLYCVQNATSQVCQNFANQTSGIISANTKVNARDFAEFAFFSAPYFSSVCNPNVTNPNNTQLYKSSNYTYHIELDDYLLTKGSGLSDQWVPARNSVLKVDKLQGQCVRSLSNHPCGMGLGPNVHHNQSHIHPWNVSSSPNEIKFKEDAHWSRNSTQPVWYVTTNDTRGAIYATTYVTVDGQISDGENIYWYVCPWQTQLMGVVFRNGKDVEDYGETSYFTHGGRELSSEGIPFGTNLYVGVSYTFSLIGSAFSYSTPWWWTGPNGFIQLSLNLDCRCTKADPKDIDGNPSLIVSSDFSSTESSVLYGYEVVGRTEIKASIWSLIQPVTIALTGEYRSLFGTEKYTQKITANPLLSFGLKPASLESNIDLKYVTDENLVTMKIPKGKFDVSVFSDVSRKTGALIDGLKSIEFGVLVLLKDGQISSSPGNYDVFNLKQTVVSDAAGNWLHGSKTVPTKLTESTDISVEVPSLDGPGVFTAPFYTQSCDSSDTPTVINQYSWSDILIEEILLVKQHYSNGYDLDSYWVPVEKIAIKLVGTPVLSCPQENIDKGGCGLGLDDYFNLWNSLPTPRSQVSYETTNMESVVYKQPLKKATSKQIYVSGEIVPVDSSTNGNGEESWIMCPNPAYHEMAFLEGFSTVEDFVP